MRLVSLAVFFYCSTFPVLAKSNLPSTVLPTESIPFQLSYASLDLDYGKNLDLLFNELSDNQLKKKSLNNFNKYKDKPHSFAFINPIYDRLNNILAISDQDSFYSRCSISSKEVNAFTDNLNTRMNITIDRYCRNLFLKRLTSFSANINFSSRDLTYFKDASPFLCTGESNAELVLLLKHYKTNPIEHEKLSNILIEKFIEYKIKPPTNILVALKINGQFNKFLQANLNLDQNSNSYFQNEYQKLSTQAQDAAEDGDIAKAKIIINNAVTFYNRNNSFINAHKAWYGVVLTGKEIFYKGKDTDAIEIFNLAKTISSKENASESFFYLLWPHIINKDYKAMKEVVDKYSLDKNFWKYDAKLQFWISYCLLKIGDDKKASSLFHELIRTSPYSFYSIVSLKELANLNKGLLLESEILSKLISNDEPIEYSFDKMSSHLKDSLRRLAVWNKLNNEKFTMLELQYIMSLRKEETFVDSYFEKTVSVQAHKEFLIINLIRLLNFQKRYISSFKVFQESLEKNSLSLNFKLIKYIFPLNYIDLIKKNSDNIDPLIVLSLIRQESAFNPEARSGVGAKGLMQLMPATAKRLSRKVRTNHLGNPEINVAIGSKYLKQLIARYDGNLIYALASYNAGESRIDRWKKNIFRNDDPLATIESIPFEETRNYVKLIYRNNFFYSLISNRSVLMVPLEETFKIGAAFKNE